MSATLATGTALLVTSERQPDLLRRALLEASYRTVVVVGTVAEASSRLSREDAHFDLVVYDLGPSGREPIAELPRLARRTQATPFVVIANEDHLGAALCAGATEVVARPIRTRELIARLRWLRVERERELRQVTRERKQSDAIRQLQDTNRELERLVCIDALTGLANRRHALALLDAECKRSLRDHVPLSVAMIDVDGLHSFNDRNGYPAGDRCLQRVASSIAHCLRRPGDFVGRYGGEELVAVLPNTAATGVANVAARMRETVEQLAIPHLSSPCSLVVTISVGFASQTRVISTAELLVAAADAALLRAKQSGRNCVVGNAEPTVTQTNGDRWKRFPPVIADPWFADRIPAFLVGARERAELVVEAAHQGSTDGAAMLARHLKVGAVECGLDALQRMAVELENAARIQDATTIARLVDAVLDFVDHVQVVYRRPIESAQAEPSSS